MTPTSDAEIEMQAFRLVRSDNYRTAEVLLKALQEDFPNESRERLLQCIGQLARRLLKDNP